MMRFEYDQKFINLLAKEMVKELGCQIVPRSYSANCYILHSDGRQKK